MVSSPFYHRFAPMVIGAVLASLFLAPVVRAAGENFSDVPRTSAHFLPIQFFVSRGVIQGYSDGTFRPDSPINRAEVLKIILTASGTEVLKSADTLPFPDVAPGDWFAPYVLTAHTLGFISGNADNSFAPGRQVNRAEFLKMLLAANGIAPEAPAEDAPAFTDVPRGEWFAPYLHYAAALGVVEADADSRVYPHHLLTRGEVAEMLYLMIVVKSGADTQFLLDRTEDHLAQIEVYIAANRVDLAKRTSGLAVDFSQQALKNMPQNNVVLGAAKLARAYDFLVDAYMAGIGRRYMEASDIANQAIVKAGEAWQANGATQPIARHIKDRAREILAQVGGEEWPAAER